MASCRPKNVPSLSSSIPEAAKQQVKGIAWTGEWGTRPKLPHSQRGADGVTVTQGGRGGAESMEITNKVEPHRGIGTEQCLGW